MFQHKVGKEVLLAMEKRMRLVSDNTIKINMHNYYFKQWYLYKQTYISQLFSLGRNLSSYKFGNAQHPIVEICTYKFGNAQHVPISLVILNMCL